MQTVIIKWKTYDCVNRRKIRCCKQVYYGEHVLCLTPVWRVTVSPAKLRSFMCDLSNPCSGVGTGLTRVGDRGVVYPGPRRGQWIFFPHYLDGLPSSCQWIPCYSNLCGISGVITNFPFQIAATTYSRSKRVSTQDALDCIPVITWCYVALSFLSVGRVVTPPDARALVFVQSIWWR